MNDSITPLDLLRLARAEFKRYDALADQGSMDMFASASLAKQLILEAIDRMEPLLARIDELEAELADAKDDCANARDSLESLG